MASPLRLGVVGCGNIAVLVHLRSARRLPAVDVVALADPSSAALGRAARLAPAATRHASVDDLLDEPGVDAVLVATPSAAHADTAVATLESGRHLYLEKPVGVTLGEGERVAAAASQAGVVSAVGFNRRFHPLLVGAAKALRTGSIGPPVRVRASFAEPPGDGSMPEWKQHRATGGGAPLDLASHQVDLCRWLTGAEPVAVAATLRSVRSEHDDATLVYAFGDCQAILECSFVQPRCDELELEDETGRTLRVSRYAGRLLLSGRPVRTRATSSARARVLLGRFGDLSYRAALAAFAARVRGGDVSLPTLDDGLASLRAIVEAEAIAT